MLLSSGRKSSASEGGLGAVFFSFLRALQRKAFERLFEFGLERFCDFLFEKPRCGKLFQIDLPDRFFRPDHFVLNRLGVEGSSPSLWPYFR